MLLKIRTTHAPATDLGFLLHKNPVQFQTFDLSFGKAHVFYPEASDAACSVCLLLDVDSVGLVRKDGKSAQPLEHYVNDKPYAASSFLSVAIVQVFRSALAGQCKERAELVNQAIPLECEICSVPCRPGEQFLRGLFEPLGYEVSTAGKALDERFPEWGLSHYYDVRLKAVCRLQDLLNHLYVLIPVMDNDKHYYVGEDEVAKLIKRGEGWLSQHPQKNAIANRYLRHKRSLTQLALAQLIEETDEADDETQAATQPEEVIEERISLNEQRIGSVISVLRKFQARKVIDLGCGSGKLVKALLEFKEFESIVGMDVSYRSLEMAERRLHYDRMNERMKERVQLIHGSLTYKDDRLKDFDAATCVEVIEHLDPPRLTAFERVLFEYAKPKVVVITTPNSEYNVRFETLPHGQFRHSDHRFEWNRREFHEWSENVAKRFAYSVSYLPVGDDDPEVGPPTQMGIFSR
jgi:3' terminal RNA ribose 2'-O-methyltransferase Hen1